MQLGIYKHEMMSFKKIWGKDKLSEKDITVDIMV
jgi:hypothetical protein